MDILNFKLDDLQKKKTDKKFTLKQVFHGIKSPFKKGHKTKY